MEREKPRSGVAALTGAEESEVRRISMERLKMKDFPRRETDSAEVLERIGHLEHCAAELAQAAKAVMEVDNRNLDIRERLRKYLMTVDEAYVSVCFDAVR